MRTITPGYVNLQQNIAYVNLPHLRYNRYVCGKYAPPAYFQEICTLRNHAHYHSRFCKYAAYHILCKYAAYLWIRHTCEKLTYSEGMPHICKSNISTGIRHRVHICNILILYMYHSCASHIQGCGQMHLQLSATVSTKQ